MQVLTGSSQGSLIVISAVSVHNLNETWPATDMAGGNVPIRAVGLGCGPGRTAMSGATLPRRHMRYGDLMPTFFCQISFVLQGARLWQPVLQRIVRDRPGQRNLAQPLAWIRAEPWLKLKYIWYLT